MVGVPGRSQGCKTCRKRKIACTLERPHCFQCVRSGRTCLGYQNERIFVLTSTSSRKLDAAWRPDSYRPATEVGTSLVASGPKSLEKSAIRHQMLGTFLAPFEKAALSGDSTGLWMTMIPDVLCSSPAMEIAAFAVCTATLGRLANTSNDDLVHTSLKLYGQGLYATQKALLNKTTLYDDRTLAACALLAMYETLECPSGGRDGYLAHFEGCSRLIQLRGPEAHREGVGHSIFIAFRTMGALEGLLRKESFLREDVWKTVPFSKTVKTPVDKLLDLVLEAPPLLSRADKLVRITSLEAQLEEAIDMAWGCWQLDSDLQRFHDDFKATADGPLYWARIAGPPLGIDNADDALETVFPLEFIFNQQRVGATLMLYWATLAILWSGMCHLHAHIHQLCQIIPGKGHNLPALNHRTDLTILVQNVCQSVRFCTQEQISLPFITAPLNMVLQTIVQWPGYEREIRWIKKSLDNLRERGVGIVPWLPK